MPTAPVTDLLAAAPANVWRETSCPEGSGQMPAGAALETGYAGEPYHFHLLLAGEAVVYLEDARGGRERLGVLRPGDGFWGHLGMERPGESFAVVARVESHVLAYRDEDYVRLVSRHPELTIPLERLHAHRLRQSIVLLAGVRRRRSQREQFSGELSAYRDAPPLPRSGPMRMVAERVDELAAGRTPVLVEGEYGTGKQLVAWHLHRRAGLPEDAFVPLDASRLTEQNWRAALLGEGDREDPSRTVGALELAQGGTLFLRHCEHLSAAAQVGLRELLERGDPGCRVVASARGRLDEAVRHGGFDPRLHALLAAEVIAVPPLRERKRELPALVAHFVGVYAAQLNRPVHEVTQSAMKRLLGHDFRQGNVKELEQALERAVALPSDDRIWSHHLFLGAPAEEPDQWHFDLLRLPWLRRWILGQVYPGRVQVLTAAAFTALIAVCLFGPQEPGRNLGLVLVWGVWWPAMFLSFPWIGRTWCSICAYSAYAHLAKRTGGFDLRLPEFVRNQGPLLAATAFLVVLWVEEVSHMRASPRGTGLLMFSLLALAVGCAFVFRRESWCRYLCPLGGMIGVSSMASALEVRANTDVCLNRCKKSLCYHGTDEVPGCPMFEHLAFVDTSQTCKLCFCCVRSCPYDAVSVNLRLPGREIWLLSQVRDVSSLFVCVLLGGVLPSLYIQTRGLALEAWSAHALFTLAHFGSPAVLAALLWLPGRVGQSGGLADQWKRFWMVSYAYVPLAVATHLAFRLIHLAGFESLRFAVIAPGRDSLSGPLVAPVQAAAIAAGCVYSWYCLDRVRRKRSGRDFAATRWFWVGHGTAIAGYAAVALWLVLSQG